YQHSDFSDRYLISHQTYNSVTTFTKVVTQFVQFLSDSRTATALDEQVETNVVDEEEMELTA
ncbi:MAG: hypothetical protein ABI904_22970, partial [Chloroflexota bacterium]